MREIVVELIRRFTPLCLKTADWNFLSLTNQKSQGEMISRPVVQKSVRLRVARRPPFTRAIAAIMPSGADMPSPSRDAAPMISP